MKIRRIIFGTKQTDMD